jgi:hypothetical protein
MDSLLRKTVVIVTIVLRNPCQGPGGLVAVLQPQTEQVIAGLMRAAGGWDVLMRPGCRLCRGRQLRPVLQGGGRSLIRGNRFHYNLFSKMPDGYDLRHAYLTCGGGGMFRFIRRRRRCRRAVATKGRGGYDSVKLAGGVLKSSVRFSLTSFSAILVRPRPRHPSPLRNARSLWVQFAPVPL